MIYPPPFSDNPVIAPGRPPRPWPVSLAVVFALAVTGGLVLSSATVIEEWLRTPDLITEAAAAGDASADEVAAEREIVPVLYPVILLLHGVLGAGFAGLAVPVWRGRNGARMALCVVAGISTLCCGGLVGLWALLPDGFDDSAFSAELYRLTELTTPAWARVASVLSGVLLVVAPIGTLTFLLLPASNRFFRKPPSTGPAGGYGWPYPGHPPPYPGGPWSDPGYPPPENPAAHPGPPSGYGAPPGPPA